MHKDVKLILAEAEAEAQGFQVVWPGSGTSKSQHAKVYGPGGAWITNFPGTPGNDAVRSIRNSLAPLKRAGFVWPPPAKKGRKK